jgi:hypothetical protein
MKGSRDTANQSPEPGPASSSKFKAVSIFSSRRLISSRSSGPGSPCNRSMSCCFCSSSFTRLVVIGSTPSLAPRARPRAGGRDAELELGFGHAGLIGSGFEVSSLLEPGRLCLQQHALHIHRHCGRTQDGAVSALGAVDASNVRGGIEAHAEATLGGFESPLRIPRSIA